MLIAAEALLKHRVFVFFISVFSFRISFVVEGIPYNISMAFLLLYLELECAHLSLLESALRDATIRFLFVNIFIRILRNFTLLKIKGRFVPFEVRLAQGEARLGKVQFQD